MLRIATTECEGPITKIGKLCIDGTSAVGELALFFLNMLSWLVTRLPRRPVLLLCM